MAPFTGLTLMVYLWLTKPIIMMCLSPAHGNSHQQTLKFESGTPGHWYRGSGIANSADYI
jgi:hypothetical protein